MKKLYCLLTIAVLGLNACSFAKISTIPSYKLEIIQGNDLDSQTISHLQTGMSREQVQMLLGTPLLQDPFHANRWDYIFVINRNGINKENKSLTLYFNNQNQLTRIEGDATMTQPVIAAPLWDVENKTE